MRYGASFPHAIGTDAVAIRDYVQSLEGAGFDYMIIIDHIAGVHRSRFGEAGPPFNYTNETATHELFTLMSYVAGVTQTLEVVPSVLLLPQRPTVLAAKQAAEVSILSKAGCALWSALAGTMSSTRRWAPTSITAAPGSKSRSRS